MNHPLETDCQSVQARMKSADPFLLLDCRELDEWETARIEGATLIPMSQLQTRVGELEDARGRDIIVYCHHGARSLRVAHWLRQQGFETTQSMSGGIDEWSQTIDAEVPRY